MLQTSESALGAPPDITKPLIARPGARGCESAEEVTRLVAAPAGSAVEGCYALEPGTRGYFIDERGDPPSMIALEIKVDWRARLLWVPADALRNP